MALYFCVLIQLLAATQHKDVLFIHSFIGVLSARQTIADHGIDVEVCSKVTRNAVHRDVSREFQAAQHHRVLCRNTTRCYDVHTRPQQQHKIVHRCICQTTHTITHRLQQQC